MLLSLFFFLKWRRFQALCINKKKIAPLNLELLTFKVELAEVRALVLQHYCRQGSNQNVSGFGIFGDEVKP